MDKFVVMLKSWIKKMVLNKCSEKQIASNEFDKKQKLNWILILVLISLVFLVISLSFFKTGGILVKYENIEGIELHKFNDEDEEIDLNANITIGNANGDLNFTTLYPKEKPSDEEIVDRLLNVINEDLLRNENKSLSEVTSKLYLETKNTYGAIINYESVHGYINIKTGEVTRKPKGSGDSKDVLKVIVSFGDVKKVKEIKVTIKEDERTSEEIRVEKTLKALKELVKENLIIEDGKLINNIEGVPISFSKVIKVEKSDYLFYIKIVLLICISIIGLYLYESYKKIIDNDKERTKTLENEFPNFIEEYMLLSRAGYTFPVAIDYISNKNDIGILNKELKRMSEEITRDVILYDALNTFAIRSGSEMIKKFILGLSSNLKRGSSQMNLFLAKELELSNIERRNEYERRASENSTKAILPLLLVLIATMLMVVYPATLALKI